MRWGGHVERMGDIGVWWKSLREMRTLERPRRKLEDNIRKGSSRIGMGGMDRIGDGNL